LNKGDILSKYNTNTARKNLQRSVFLIEQGNFPGFKTIKYKDYNIIDKILDSKKHSTVVIKWKNG